MKTNLGNKPNKNNISLSDLVAKESISGGRRKTIFGTIQVVIDQGEIQIKKSNVLR